ncbi:MAG: anhydro-N-acetylmuramic acid kinase [Gammaproteobacteria bacterium]|nr:anhydro-N-acetylmuramic acid kinase [Gammaproteobacteria bacterium]MXW09887.1 anhydro-N-acetylmuramic acid kinase [Gammaproteobacteria bacterium]MYC50980.1 anhydro-N-acetylmuramic acid kinase [Gammaproteobacteria bacterium]
MKVLGMMSGTSLDGVDAALLEVGGTTPGTFSWRLLGFHSESYRPEERDSIRRAIEGGGPADLARLHAALGERFARCALTGCARAGVDPGSVAAIGSHGQTVWHDPPSGDARGATLQLGDPATIAEITGIPVVSDFRTRDVAAGGHGAPLVPWPDRLLFSAPDRPRALQNLGGMANVTWLPAASDGQPVLAFDTGPGVALIDTAAELATDGRRTFDADGELAAAGEVDNDLLAQLLQHPFLHRPPPKSTGREVFGSAFVERLVERVVPRTKRDWAGLVATLTAFTAASVADACRRWVLPRGASEVLLAGGGALNPVLAAMISDRLAPVPVRDLSVLGLEPEAREAACFAVLAWAHLRGLPANSPASTGASGRRVLGSLTPGGA